MTPQAAAGGQRGAVSGLSGLSPGLMTPGVMQMLSGGSADGSTSDDKLTAIRARMEVCAARHARSLAPRTSMARGCTCRGIHQAAAGAHALC